MWKGAYRPSVCKIHLNSGEPYLSLSLSLCRRGLGLFLSCSIFVSLAFRAGPTQGENQTVEEIEASDMRRWGPGLWAAWQHPSMWKGAYRPSVCKIHLNSGEPYLSLSLFLSVSRSCFVSFLFYVCCPRFPCRPKTRRKSDGRGDRGKRHEAMGAGTWGILAASFNVEGGLPPECG